MRNPPARPANLAFGYQQLPPTFFSPLREKNKKMRGLLCWIAESRSPDPEHVEGERGSIWQGWDEVAASLRSWHMKRPG